MIAVTVAEISSQDSSRVGAPHVVLEGHYLYATPLRSYDVTADS